MHTCTYIHTYIHTYIQHTYIHTYIQSYNLKIYIIVVNLQTPLACRLPEVQHAKTERRNIIIFGKTGSGKSTVANHILGCEAFDSLKENPTYITEVSIVGPDDTIYIIRLVDAIGQFDSTNTAQIEKFVNAHVRGNFLDLHLVMFVCRHDRLIKEEMKTFEFFIKKYQQTKISQISALILTCCEGLSIDQRKKFNDDFRINSQTSHIAAFMRKGIHQVGFPDIRTVKPDLKASFERGADEDAKTLRQLIFHDCTRMFPIEEVFPKSVQCSIV